MYPTDRIKEKKEIEFDKIYKLLDELQENARNLLKSGHDLAFNALNDLVASLENLTSNALKKGFFLYDAYDVYKQQVVKIINDKRPELDKHQPVKEILIDLELLITSLACKYYIEEDLKSLPEEEGLRAAIRSFLDTIWHHFSPIEKYKQFKELIFKNEQYVQLNSQELMPVLEVLHTRHLSKRLINGQISIGDIKNMDIPIIKSFNAMYTKLDFLKEKAENLRNKGFDLAFNALNDLVASLENLTSNALKNRDYEGISDVLSMFITTLSHTPPEDLQRQTHHFLYTNVLVNVRGHYSEKQTIYDIIFHNKEFAKLSLGESCDVIFKLIKCGLDSRPYILKKLNKGQISFQDFKNIPPKYIELFSKIHKKLDKIKEEAPNLHVRRHNAAYQATNDMVSSIESSMGNFFFKNALKYEEFAEETKNIINRYKPELEKHRGYKEILVNLLVLITTLGTAQLIKYAYTNSFMFRVKTDSAEKIGRLREAIQKVAPCEEPVINLPSVDSLSRVT